MDNNSKKFWNSNSIVEYFASKSADPFIVARLGMVNDTKNKTALDIGCGGGRHTELLSSLGFSVTAIDINPEMVKYTQKRLAQAELPATVKQMAIEDMDFPMESFDIVLSTGVLHQVTSLDDYRKVLQSISDILKKDGLFTMNIFTNKVWDSTYEVVNPKEPNTILTQEKLHMTLLSREQFYSIADDAGLIVEKEMPEDIKQENTGLRAVLRAHLVKKR